MNGFIYFISNRSMPDLVKIGYTTGTVESRLSQLNSTGVPTPFKVMAQFYVCNPELIEKELHQKLKRLRLNNQREFFSGTTSDILGECFSIIFEAIPVYTSTDGSPKIVDHYKFSNVVEELLWTLVRSREKGCHMYEFQDNDKLNCNSLILERELETLKSDGFVEFKRANGSRNLDYWRLTSKGIKMLFDVGFLSEDNMNKTVWPYE